MAQDPIYIGRLKEAVALKFHTIPKTPSEFGMLSVNIMQTTGRHIGVSTLERLWGYVKSKTSPSVSTLNLLSRYVGYPDWDEFCSATSVDAPPYETSGFNKEDVIHTDELPIDTEIRIDWHPRKYCLVKKIAQPFDFVVLESGNIKLEKGDLIELRALSKGMQFQAVNCRRNGESVGTYSGAHLAGIFSLEILKK